MIVVERSETTVEEEEEEGEGEKEGQPSLIIYYCTYLPVIAICIAEVSVLSRSFSRWFSGKKWQKKMWIKLDLCITEPVPFITL